MRVWIGAVVLALGAWPAVSGADFLEAPTGDAREIGHDVDVRRAGGGAVLEVTRTFIGYAPQPEQLVLFIDEPYGAVARGLWIRERTRWLPGKLLPARRAAEQYRELTGARIEVLETRRRGKDDGKDPAILYLGSHGLTLQAFPLVPGVPYQVRYTLWMPLEREHDRWVFHYPVPDDRRLLGPRVRVEGRGAAAISAPGKPVLVTFPAAPLPAVTARFGSHTLPDGRTTIVHVEVSAPAQLGSLPGELRVVFVVDASGSAGEDGIAAELELMKAYLGRVPGVRFEIVLFRRTAERLIGAFAPAVEVDAILDRYRARLRPGNGSSLVRGLQLAVEALREGQGPAQVIILTDGRFSGESAAGARLAHPLVRGLGADTTVHVVQRSGPDYLSCQDEPGWQGPLHVGEAGHGSWTHYLGGLAARGSGLWIQVEGRFDRAADSARVFDRLLRPTRLSDVRVLPAAGFDRPLAEQIDEGQRGAGTWVLADRPGPLRIEATLGGRRVSWPARHDQDLSRTLPLRYFGTLVHGEVIDDEPEGALARRAGVVSRHTSLLASGGAPAGPAPALEDVVRIFSSYSCGGWAAPRALTPEELRARVEPQVRRCLKGAGGQPVRVHMELAHREVERVVVTGTSVQRATCISDRLWAMAVSEHRSRHASFRFEF